MHLSEGFEHTRVLDEVYGSFSDESRVVLITGKQGAGVSTFIGHLKKRFPHHNRLNVQYSNFSMSDNVRYFISIDGVAIQQFIREGSPEHFVKMVNNGPPETVAVIEVNYANPWYRQYVSQSKQRYDFKIFDLSSDTYRLNTQEKMDLIETVCRQQNIAEESLSKNKRKEIAKFEGQNCGFPFLFNRLINEKKFENPVQFMQEEDDKYKPLV